MSKRVVANSLVLAVLISLVAVRPALAYVDPNTGGMVFQMLAAAFTIFSGIALVFARQIRMGFARAMRSLRHRFNRDSQQVQGAQAPTQHAEGQKER